MQRWFLPYPSIIKFFNVYYATVHFPALIIFLIWCFFRHREHYPSVRNTVAILTAACLLIQLIPVAPPRMFANLGFVDTALRYGQSVYGAVGSGFADQLSAMPSVHVGWAVLDRGVRAPDQPEPVALARARAHDAHDLDRHGHREPLVARRHRRGHAAWAWRWSPNAGAARWSPGCVAGPRCRPRRSWSSRRRGRIGARMSAARGSVGLRRRGPVPRSTRMADTVRGIDPETPVPTCPEWTVAELVEAHRHRSPVGRRRWCAIARPSGSIRARSISACPTMHARLRRLARGRRRSARRRVQRRPIPTRRCGRGVPISTRGSGRAACCTRRPSIASTPISRSGPTRRSTRAVAADAIDELLENLPDRALLPPSRRRAARRRRVDRAARARTRGERWLIVLQPGGWDWESPGRARRRSPRRGADRPLDAAPLRPRARSTTTATRDHRRRAGPRALARALGALSARRSRDDTGDSKARSRSSPARAVGSAPR